MSRSSLLGIDRPNPRAPGHDDAALGPSDSSDSGGDMTGLDASDLLDAQLPLDFALAEVMEQTPDDGPGASEYEDPAEDESADPVGDGRADAALAASMPPRPDRPNPEPDPPEGQPPLSPGGETPPADDGTGPHPPGRDPGALHAGS